MGTNGTGNPNTGGANPTPIPEISVPLVQSGEMLQCIIVPGVWFVFRTLGAVQATGRGSLAKRLTRRWTGWEGVGERKQEG